jgi:hypothetical protein
MRLKAQSPRSRIDGQDGLAEDGVNRVGLALIFRSRLLTDGFQSV